MLIVVDTDAFAFVCQVPKAIINEVVMLKRYSLSISCVTLNARCDELKAENFPNAVLKRVLSIMVSFSTDRY